MATREETAKASPTDQPASPWVAALSELREWDPAWAELAVKITTNPWTDGVLPRKFIELVSFGLNGGNAPPHPGGPRGRREPPERELERESTSESAGRDSY